MRQSAAASFIADNGIFIRDEYAAAVGRRVDDDEVSAMLARHVEADDIRGIAPDVFVSVVYHSDPDKPSPDCFLEAVRLRPDAVIAYHSALEIRGCAYAHGFVVQAVSPGPPETIETGRRVYRFMAPPPGLALGDGDTPDGVEAVVHMGLEIRRTTIERTIVDLFARPSMGGDILLDSLFFVNHVDPAAIARHARAVGDAAAAGALGFWLESEREQYGVDDATLEALRALAPRRPRYAMGAGPGLDMDGRECLLGEGWNVILPAQMVKPFFEGHDPDELEEFAAWCRGRA